jgi:hypothetical protein
MRKYELRAYGPILLLLLGLFSAASLFAQEARPEANWANLKQVSPSDEVRVILADGKSFDGKFQTYTDSAVILRTITGEQSLSRESVLRISAKGKSHRWRNALIGAGIGAGAGVGIAAAWAASQREEYPQNRYLEVYGPVLGVSFGATGAAVGALLSRDGWHVVYRAR